MARRAKGLARPDPQSKRHQLDARAHPAIRSILATTLPSQWDLASFQPPIFDQGQSGSCTAHSFAGLAYTALNRAGTPLSFVPSPREIYAATRGLERAASGPPPYGALTDSGAELNDVLTAMGSYGVAPYQGPTPDGRQSDIWTSADTTTAPPNVNDEADFGQLEQANTTLLSGAYRIDTTASDAVDVLCAAIYAGFPIYGGFFCDEAFEELASGAVAGAPNTSDPEGGGHAIYLAGYQTVSGVKQIELTNSWGTSWCTSGKGLVGAAWVAAMWDAYVGQVKVAR